MTAHKNPGIVVSVDQPPIGHDAALWSAGLAERLNCPLRIVYVVPEASHTRGDIAQIFEPTTAGTRKTSPAIVDEALAAVRRTFPDLMLSGGLIEGPAWCALATAGRGARIVVLGHPDIGATDVLATNSRASTMTEQTMCPVIMWRGQPGQLPDRRPVVLGVGEAADSADAIRAAFEYAHLFEAPLVAVHSRPTPAATGSVTAPDANAREHATEQDILETTLSAAHRAFPDVAVTAAVVPDPPHKALIERAADAQLVVIGTHRREHASSPFAASVSPFLFRHNRCPTMACPPSLPPNDTSRRTRSLTPHASASAGDVAIPGITIRYLTPDDRDAVRDLHEQMSAEDAHLRFFSPRPNHLKQFAERLCEQDFTHLALGAFEGDELVGVANYIVTDTRPGRITAEMALAVTGNEQQNGIGTLLVRQLGTAAYLHGVAHLTAEILAENTLMLAIITEQGWSHALRHDGPLAHFDLELISHNDAPPETPSSTDMTPPRKRFPW